MTVRLADHAPQKKPFFSGWHYLIMVFVLVLLVLLWFVSEKWYSPVEMPKSTVPISKQPLPSSESTQETKSSDVDNKRLPAESVPKPLNLNLAPIATTDQMGPEQTLDDVIVQPSTGDKNASQISQEQPADFLYDYKGRDKKSVHLELGASKDETQIKFGVQMDERKLNVNSIEVEIPLSK